MDDLEREFEAYEKLVKILNKFGNDNNCTESGFLSFLASMVVSTLEAKGYSEEFAAEAFDRMKERFVFLRKRRNNGL